MKSLTLLLALFIFSFNLAQALDWTLVKNGSEHKNFYINKTLTLIAKGGTINAIEIPIKEINESEPRYGTLKLSCDDNKISWAWDDQLKLKTPMPSLTGLSEWQQKRAVEQYAADLSLETKERDAQVVRLNPDMWAWSLSNRYCFKKMPPNNSISR